MRGQPRNNDVCSLERLNLYFNHFYENCIRACPVFLTVNCGTQENLSGGLRALMKKAIP